MFQPRAFTQNDEQAQFDLIEQFPFATLITHTTSEIYIDHIPLIVQRNKDAVTLQGHLARPNPVVGKIEQNTRAIAIFHGPDHYVTPGWYPSKKVHGKVVPTWNYAVVHVRGILSLRDDADWVLDLVNRLTNKQEQSQSAPWKVSDAPDDYIRSQLGAIVGIELAIDSLEGKWKLSQNKPKQDLQGVKDGVAKDLPDNPIREMMGD